MTLGFIAGQDGELERDLKAKLARAFSDGEFAVRRAFLVIVELDVGASPTVALCIRAPGQRQEAVVAMVQQIFAPMFNADQFLDVVFMDEVEAAAVAKVARPFYPSSHGCQSVPN